MSVFLTAAQTSPYVMPTATPPGDLFFEYAKPDGTSFIATAANAEQYLRLGYTVSGEHTLNDSDDWRAAVSPGSQLPPASGVETTEATATPGAMPQTPPAA